MSTQTATRPNAYAGDCSSCGTRVAASAGLLGPKVNGRWTVQHTTCPTATTRTRTSAPRVRTSADADFGRGRNYPTRTNDGTCESCGRRGAHWATDMSGISGYACRTCDDGSLSLC